MQSTPRSRALALTLVMVALVRFSLAQSPQEPLQASIFDSIHTLIFGSSSSAPKTVVKTPSRQAASSSSIAVVSESSSAVSYAPAFTVPTQKWVTVQGYRFMRTLRNGMMGDDVMNLQFILNRNPTTQMAKTGVESPGQETGIYGYKTRIGIIAFQKLYLKTAAQLVRLHREQGIAGLTTRTILEKIAKEMLASGALPSSTDTLHAAARSAASAQLALRSSANSSVGSHIAMSQSSSAASTTSTTSISSAAQSSTSAVSSTSISHSSTALSLSSSSSSTPIILTSRVLVPGSGFAGITVQPPQRGSGQASDEKAIARWDVVPYQTFNTAMNVGVVAFHINDIEKVSFSVNGGPWKDVPSMTLNPETNVVEYWVTLRASDFSDGQVEVRAIAYPNAGIPRVLAGVIPSVTTVNTTRTNGEHSMWLFANAGGALKTAEIYVRPTAGNDANAGSISAPVATLRKALSLAVTHDGARIILLEAGNYNPDRENGPDATAMTNSRWVTVEAGPSLTREQVNIVGIDDSDRLIPRIARIEWKNVTLRPDTYSYINETNLTTPNFQWYENCLITAGTNFRDDDVPQARGNVYVTNSRVDRYSYGFTAAELVRNSVVKDVYDAYQLSKIVINSRVERTRITVLGGEHHPDFYQTWGDVKNVILYGMSGDDIDGMQVFFINQPLSVGPDMTDAAFVDWDVKTYDVKGGPPFSQMQGPFHNILFRNINVPGQKFLFRTGITGEAEFSADNVVFQNAKFYSPFAAKDIPAGVIFNGIVGGTAGTSSSVASSKASSSAVSSLAVSSVPTSSAAASSAVPISSAASSVASIAPPSSSSVASTGGGAATGLIGYWPFDGNANDASGNGNNGTLTGSPAFAAGKNGQALSCDGVDDVMTRSAFNGGSTTQGSIAFWLYYPASVANYGFVTTSTQAPLLYDASGKMTVGIWDTTLATRAIQMSEPSTIPLNQWVHYTVTYDTAGGRLYRDGVEVVHDVTGVAAYQTINGSTLYICSNRNIAGRFLNGKMDEVHIYDRALTAGEVSQLYAGTLAMHETPGFFDFLKHLLASLFN